MRPLCVCFNYVAILHSKHKQFQKDPVKIFAFFKHLNGNILRRLKCFMHTVY